MSEENKAEELDEAQETEKARETITEKETNQAKQTNEARETNELKQMERVKKLRQRFEISKEDLCQKHKTFEKYECVRFFPNDKPKSLAEEWKSAGYWEYSR